MIHQFVKIVGRHRRGAEELGEVERLRRKSILQY